MPLMREVHVVMLIFINFVCLLVLLVVFSPYVKMPPLRTHVGVLASSSRNVLDSEPMLSTLSPRAAASQSPEPAALDVVWRENKDNHMEKV